MNTSPNTAAQAGNALIVSGSDNAPSAVTDMDISPISAAEAGSQVNTTGSDDAATGAISLPSFQPQ